MPHAEALAAGPPRRWPSEEVSSRLGSRGCWPASCVEGAHQRCRGPCQQGDGAGLQEVVPGQRNSAGMSDVGCRPGEAAHGRPRRCAMARCRQGRGSSLPGRSRDGGRTGSTAVAASTPSWSTPAAPWTPPPPDRTGWTCSVTSRCLGRSGETGPRRADFSGGFRTASRAAGARTELRRRVPRRVSRKVSRRVQWTKAWNPRASRTCRHSLLPAKTPLLPSCATVDLGMPGRRSWNAS